MKSLLVKLGVILIGLVIFGYAEVWGADWKFYASSEEDLYYYDAQSITRPSNHIVRVWFKLVHKQEKEKFSYTLYINCADKKHRGLSGIGYSKEGQSSTLLTTPTEWGYIPPDSTAEVLYKAVCK